MSQGTQSCLKNESFFIVCMFRLEWELDSVLFVIKFLPPPLPSTPDTRRGGRRAEKDDAGNA